MFSKNEYVYEHDVKFRTKITEKARGLCVAWTVHWLNQNLTGMATNTIYTEEQIDQLIKKHQEYIDGRDMEKYCQKEGLKLRKIKWEEISYWGGLKELDQVQLAPQHGYLVELESKGGMDPGHVFGLFREQDSLLFFDQNFGLVRVSGLERLNEEYTKEVQIFEDELALKLRHWNLYEVALAQ